jgi:hypothetical protein
MGRVNAQGSRDGNLQRGRLLREEEPPGADPHAGWFVGGES